MTKEYTGGFDSICTDHAIESAKQYCGEVSTITETAQLACQAIRRVREMNQPLPQPTNAHGALARIAVMLSWYSATSETILSALHDFGYVEITLEEVAAVRDYILEN